MRGRLGALGLVVAVLLGAGAAAAGVRSDRRSAPVRAAGRITATPTTTTAPPTSVPVVTTSPPPPAPPSPPTTTPPPPPPPPPDPLTLLQSRLGSAVAGTAACLAVYEGDRLLAFQQPDTALVPASTQKLLVAAAALSRLGPGFRFETDVFAPAAPVDGRVDSLYLVGGGDPLLATPEYVARLAKSARTRETPPTPFAALADALASAGVRSVPGGLHGDDSRYEQLRYLPTWKPAYRTEVEVGPLGALMVNGGLEAWQPEAVATADPVAHAVAQLSALLTTKGVSAPVAAAAKPPAGAVRLAKLRSAPLSQIAAAMLRSSDNLTAELLVRELDHAAGGRGTTAGGTAIVVAEAARLGLPTAGLRLVDGSGLDTGNRASCSTLLAATGLAVRPRFAALHDGLAVAAQSGTLAGRYTGTPAAGKVAAKTGWITCAAGLVGRVQARTQLRFAVLSNATCTWPAAKTMEDRVVDALVSYAS